MIGALLHVILRSIDVLILTEGVSNNVGDKNIGKIVNIFFY